jgi:hypothetical protein
MRAPRGIRRPAESFPPLTVSVARGAARRARPITTRRFRQRQRYVPCRPGGDDARGTGGILGRAPADGRRRRARRSSWGVSQRQGCARHCPDRLVARGMHDEQHPAGRAEDVFALLRLGVLDEPPPDAGTPAGPFVNPRQAHTCALYEIPMTAARPFDLTGICSDQFHFLTVAIALHYLNRPPGLSVRQREFNCGAGAAP